MSKRSRDPVPWVVGLFAANFLLQRISVPNLSIPIIVPLIVVWLGVALWAGVLSINVRRLTLWLLAGAVSGLLVSAQVILVDGPFVSFNSWLLWMVLWLPIVVHFWERSWSTYLRALRGVANVGIGIATLSLLFTVLQYVGVPYRDWVGEYVPPSLLVSGYVVSYPVAYGSEIYKSNAFLALEPSFVSFMLGVCVVAAVTAKLHWSKVIYLLLAMLATTAGSGLAIVLAFIGLAIFTGRAAMLRRYAAPAIVLGVVFATTLLGQSILNRVSEAGQSRSSTSLRMIEPYQYLWPYWVSDPWGFVLGHGAGSSAWVVTSSGIEGLLVPSVAKVFFDYGLIGGTLLAAMVTAAFVRTPEPRVALALAVSIFTVQSASPPLVVCIFVVATFWAPAALARQSVPGRIEGVAPTQLTPMPRRAAEPPNSSNGPAGPSVAATGIAARSHDRSVECHDRPVGVAAACARPVGSAGQRGRVSA